MTQKTWQECFPEFTNMPAIPDGFEDGSWENDGCPRFARADGMELFVDYADSAKRSYPGVVRFGLYKWPSAEIEKYTDADRMVLFEGDEWQGVLDAITDHDKT